MRTAIRATALSVLLAWPAARVFAETEADANGRELHDNNCVACHAGMTEGQPARIYSREKRIVSDYNGLANQVQRCALNLKLEWFDSEIQAVTDYLDQSYYHFNPAAAQAAEGTDTAAPAPAEEKAE